MTDYVAVIDLGSNSVRATMWRISGSERPEIVLREKRTPRLIEGVAADGILREKAVRRTVDAVSEIVDILKPHNPELLPVATAAVRSAANREVFLTAVKERTSIDFRPISGREEAYYGYIGVRNSIDLTNYLLVDTGGGSFEVSLVREGDLIQSESVPLGAVVLTERFLERDRISASALFEMMTDVQDRIINIPFIDAGIALPLVLVGGSNRAFAGIHRERIGRPHAKIHGYTLFAEEMKEIYSTLLSLSLEERRNFPGLNPDRADVIVGGMAPAICLLAAISGDRAVISGSGLTEGIFYEYYERLHR